MLADSKVLILVVCHAFVAATDEQKLLLVNAPVKFSHACRQLPDHVINLHLLLLDLQLTSGQSRRRFIQFDGLVGHLLNKIDFGLLCLDVLIDIFLEVIAAQWTLSLDLQPLLTALDMEIMLLIAREDDYLVTIVEVG